MKTVDEIIALNIEDRMDRMATVDEWADEYIAAYDVRPPARDLELLTDYILREELADDHPDKMSREEYPIMSEDQWIRRERRYFPISVILNTPSDIKTPIFYSTKKEILDFLVERELVKYANINQNLRVANRRMSDDEMVRYEFLEGSFSKFRDVDHVRWSRAVRRRDGYTCRSCGIKKQPRYMHAHHIDSYDWAIELRLDLSNGVTLCDTCHIDFHTRYGKGSNTRAQWEEWVGMICESA